MQTLKVIPKQSSFYIDDIIEGQVELSTSVQIIINDINVSLNISEYWYTYSKESKDNISEDKTQALITQDLDVKSKLKINTNLVAIKAGKFTFAFKFKPNKVLEPSFELPGKADKAYIRYFLASNIISPYIKGSAKSFIILKKRQKIEMNKEIILTSENSVHKWGLFNSGKTKLKVTSLNGTDTFKFGEDIKFEIDIDNTEGKLITTECKIVLKRNVKFNNSYGELKKEILDELSSKTIKAESSPGEHKSFNYVLSLKKVENKNFAIEGSGIPYTNFPDINYFLPSVKTIVLECSYLIKFTLYFNKFVKFNDRPRVIMNVIICHQSIDEYRDEMGYKLNSKPNYNRSSTMQTRPNNLLPPPNIGPPHMMPPSMMNRNIVPPSMAPPHLGPPTSMMPPSMVPPSMVNRTMTTGTMRPPSLTPSLMMPPSISSPQMKPPTLTPPSMMPPTLTPPSMMPPTLTPPQPTSNPNVMDINTAIKKMNQNFNDLYNIISGDNITMADVLVIYQKLWNSIMALNKLINIQGENIFKINQSLVNIRDKKKSLDFFSEDEKGHMITELTVANNAIKTRINAKKPSIINNNKNNIQTQNLPPSMIQQNQNINKNQNMIQQNQNMIQQNQNIIQQNQNIIQQNQPQIMINQNQNIVNQNMMPPMNGLPNFQYQNNMNSKINNGIPPQQYNNMINNDINNINDDLPSKEDVEESNNTDNNV